MPRAQHSRGKFGGRPRSLSPKKAEMARALYKDKRHTTSEICTELGISRTTLWRYEKASKDETGDGMREATSL